MLLLALAACHRPSGGDDTAPMFTSDNGLLTVPANSPLRSHLIVQTLGGGANQVGFQAPAAVEADPARVTNILTPLTGRVLAVKVALGERVRRGQALVIIASGDLDQAEADVAKAQDAFGVAKSALIRAQGVREAGGSADKDLEGAQSAYNQAQAELARARGRLVSLNGAGGGHLNQLVLTAPQDGVVTALSVAAGAQISDPTATLMTVTNIQRVFVTANIPESDIGMVAVGADADISLTAYPGQVLHGKVSQVNAVVEPDTRRQKVRIAMANDNGRLLPNMYATVRFTNTAFASASPSTGVSAPQSALLMNNDSVSVLLEVRPWVFQRRAVRIGDEDANSAQVISGLKPGDRVVVSGGVLLND
jgi:cobalt-zinc-cadmium efflux system membrane fusion protein